jgi:multiple sugar transport system permease protein
MSIQTTSLAEHTVRGAPARADGERSRRRTRLHLPGSKKSTILTIAMWTCAAYFLVPLIWLVISTSKSDGGLFSTFGLVPGTFSQLIKNVETVFTTNGGEFGIWLLNTAFYGITSAFGAVALATLAGYALAKYRFAGDRLIFSVILGAVMIPGTALAIPTYLLFAHIGLTNTAWAIILPSIVNPFGVFLMRIYAAEAVDDSLIEAARVDGAGEFRIFWTVSLRLLSPAIVTVFLFALVATWNNYLLPLIMLNNSSLFSITVGLSEWLAASNNAGGTRIAISTLITGAFISIIPLIVAFLTLQRYWQSGLSTGSVKG